MSRGPTGPALTPLEMAQRLNDRRLIALLTAQELFGAAGDAINVCVGTDFDNSAVWTTAPGTAGTGAAALSTTEAAGVVDLTSGATAGGIGAVQPVGPVSLIQNPSTDLFYAEFGAVIGAAGADSNARVGLAAPNFGNPQILMGMIGIISTVNYSWLVLGAAGATIGSGSLGVARDANYHKFACYADGTTLRFRLDNVNRDSLATATAGFPTGSMCWNLLTYNGTANTARTLSADYAWVAMAGKVA